MLLIAMKDVVTKRVYALQFILFFLITIFASLNIVLKIESDVKLNL